jgi:hypothetical protein
MKLYADKPGASIEMVVDAEFQERMFEVIRKEDIQLVFESGTYLGTGSTATIADLFIKANKTPKRFITVEANYNYFEKATKNLAKYKFIEPVFGISVDYVEAANFLLNDDIFDNLDNYKEAYIDHLTTPKHFYLQEIMVGVFQDRINLNKKSWLKRILKTNTVHPTFRNNVFSDFSNSINGTSALIILDSAAGIGFYEFTQVVKEMGNKEYILVLDDIHHLKHFRSKEFIKANKDKFELIGLNEELGWLIAKKQKS